MIELKDGARFEEVVDNNYLKMTIHGPDCTTKPEIPEFKPYNNGEWNLKYSVVDGEGLVIKDVYAGNTHVLDKISMPHSKVSFSNGQENIIRYCSSTDLHRKEPQIIGDSIRWSFFRILGMGTPNDDSDDTVLTISYNFLMRSAAVTNCEMGKNICLRLIPAVTFKASSLKQSIESL
jgi:hypothetical protein